MCVGVKSMKYFVFDLWKSGRAPTSPREQDMKCWENEGILYSKYQVQLNDADGTFRQVFQLSKAVPFFSESGRMDNK